MTNSGIYGKRKISENPTELNEMRKILKSHEKRILTLEKIVKRLEIMEAHIDAKASIEKNPLDLNGDGVVDKKDSSIAGKVLANRKYKKR